MKAIGEKPKGLDQKYIIRKMVGLKREDGSFLHENFISKEVDADAEYFVLRLDKNASDLKHVAACRIGIYAYANAIKDHIPVLAKDVIERYAMPDETDVCEACEKTFPSDVMQLANPDDTCLFCPQCHSDGIIAMYKDFAKLFPAEYKKYKQDLEDGLSIEDMLEEKNKA